MKVHSQKTGNLPDRAGLAQIRYEDIKQPKRKNENITLPSRGWDLYWLSSDQFLCSKVKAVLGGYQEKLEKRQTWFGGTDENPFLVQLAEFSGKEGYDDEKSWLDVWKQEVFYTSIKPDIITQFENIYGKKRTKRQGDIFAYPLPEQDWDKITCLMKCMKFDIDVMMNWVSDHHNKQLYGTRHILYGDFMEGGVNIIGKGKIIAPDHKPLVLTEICVLAQTKYLHSPTKAD